MIEVFRVDAKDSQIAITWSAVAFDSRSRCICSAEHGNCATKEAKANGVLKGGHCRFSFFFADTTEMILQALVYNAQKISTAMQPKQVILNEMLQLRDAKKKSVPSSKMTTHLGDKAGQLNLRWLPAVTGLHRVHGHA